ncbi:hypothetical protein CROQUDRAFT_85422 [Cronartium quercuum f. sp. fusiforme G11]|uniref:SYO1-like TPR repeats domain-containing protein n=1 Tax=Cronartium quercuum f. sp. fusiforme G11 TaxID=708437 RepID=A0A9P6THR0_9BASI|nr:hypothetical protein CROQUDRAFT_85422 [Cronartium quercuum f. sp. fusiforme G11]
MGKASAVFHFLSTHETNANQKPVRLQAQYKKRIRSARQEASTAPLTSATGAEDQPTATEEDSAPSAKRSKKRSKASQPPRQRQETISVLEKISSATPADRLWSLASVSNLILSSASTRRLLLSQNLVARLIERLTADSEQDDILIEATGALRNLAIEGGPEVCAEMANKGILRPLADLVAKLVSSFTAGTEVSASGVQALAAHAHTFARLLVLVENVITIVWSLAETSQKVLGGVSQFQGLLPLLLILLDQSAHPTLSAPELPPSLALVCAQCLYTLTEDDRRLVRSLSADKLEPVIHLFEHRLTRTKITVEEREELELLRVVCAGVLRNVLALALKPERLSFKPLFDAKMPELLVKHLEIDMQALATEAAEAQAALPTISLSDLSLAKASVREPAAAELTLESVERRLATVQLSLEILGEWCATADGFVDDEVEADEDTEMVEEPKPRKTDEDGDEKMAFDGEGEEMAGLVEGERDLVQTRSTLDRFSVLLERFVTLAQPIVEVKVEQPGMIPAATGTTSSSVVKDLLLGIQKRGLESTNNLLITLARLGDPQSFVGSRRKTLEQAWQTALAILRTQTEGLVLPAVSVLWTLLRIGACEGDQAEGPVGTLLELVRSDTVEAEVRARAIGALACLGARPKVSITENQMIGSAFMELISKATAAETVGLSRLVAIHALDAIFDVYADEQREYDALVFRQGQFLDQLSAVIPTIKSIVKTIDKRKEPELRKLAENVQTNLVAFVDYRRSLKF